MLFSLWNKFKQPLSKGNKKKLPDADTDDTTVVMEEENLKHTALSSSEKIDAISNAFQQTEIEILERNKVLSNLNALKELMDQPKENTPEMRFSKISQYLGESECHETVRQERWPVEIFCPNCLSKNLKRIAQLPTQKPHNHRYLCLDCDTAFNDDSGTAMEHGTPPLNVWMHCWYLMGCTESLNYIAKKLGLELGMVEFMAVQLQKTFHAKQPLTRFLGYDEWNKQSQQLRQQLKEDLLLQYERLSANIATVPKDTAEHRRQSILRTELKPSITPPSGGKKR